jgi:hypothetical protein
MDRRPNPDLVPEQEQNDHSSLHDMTPATERSVRGALSVQTRLMAARLMSAQNETRPHAKLHRARVPSDFLGGGGGRPSLVWSCGR